MGVNRIQLDEDGDVYFSGIDIYTVTYSELVHSENPVPKNKVHKLDENDDENTTINLIQDFITGRDLVDINKQKIDKEM